ncbi:MAG: hypothetical protein NXI24_08170 [bacterium]|nr:hypothetical protein [bacterium]
MSRISRVIARLIAGLAAFAFAASLHADTVVLKNGNRISNVRVMFQADRVNLIRADGGLQSYTRDRVRDVLREPVNWDPGIGDEEFERAMSERVNALVRRIRDEERRRANLSRDIYLGAFGRALVLPGWYQWKYRGWKNGTVYFATLGFFGGLFAYTRSRYDGARAAYSEIQAPLGAILALSNTETPVDAFIPYNYSEFQSRRRNLDRAATHVNVVGALIALTWMVNIFDAFSSAVARDRALERSIVRAGTAGVELEWTAASKPGTSEAGARDLRFAFTLRSRFD